MPAPLVRLVQRQELEFDPEPSDEVKKLRYDVDKENEVRNKAKLDVILENAPAELKLALKALLRKVPLVG